MLYENFVNNLKSLTNNFPFSKIAVAVSGGADSTALLHLASTFAEKNEIQLFVISVDHNLREQSKLENEYIKELSYKLGHSHYILNFDHQNNFSNLQARAREGRYELMTNLCQKLDVLVLLTAHHQDDYIENFCMRLERKSGTFGLSSSNINWYNNIQIVRPLFNIPKNELVNYLIINEIKWFEDESNLSSKYTRNVIRQKLAKEGNYSKTDIAAQQLKTNELLENKFQPELIAAIAESVKIYEYGFACLDLSKFITFSNEVKIQLFSFLLIMISGNKHGARFYSIELILNLIANNTKFKNTLHGCVIKREQSRLLIYKERGKNPPYDVILQDRCVIWDKRFCIKKPSFQDFMVPIRQSKRVYNITHLTLQDYKIIKTKLNLKLLKNLTFGSHIEILFTMPVIKILEKIIAIPHISYYDNDRIIFDVSFTPNFTSRFIHFY